MKYLNYICLFVLVIILACDNDDPSNEADFITFNLQNQESLSFQVDKTPDPGIIINEIAIDYEIDITNLVAEFTLSPGAVAYIDGIEQQSGITAHDFSEDLVYQVIAEDQESMRTYVVQLDRGKVASYSTLVEQYTYTNNPSGKTPLAGELHLQAKEEVIIEIRVDGSEPVEYVSPSFDRDHIVPILGLYPDKLNAVYVSVTNRDEVKARDTLMVQTEPLPDYLPEIVIDEAKVSDMEKGWHLSGLALANFGKFRSMPIVFDNEGVVRWYLDLSDKDGFCWPIRRLVNGNFFFCEKSNIYEYDMLGNNINSWLLDGYIAHHDMRELPNGNFLIAVNKEGTSIIENGNVINTTEDHIVEMDRSSGNVIREWDMREILDVDRRDLTDGGGDWFHMNAIWYNEADHSIVVSGRNQGIIKINWDNELQWILAPHKGWENAGRDGSGFDTKPYLLTAIDDASLPFDSAVQLGDKELEQFSWSWGQHAPMYLPNGNLLVFDNGFNRNFGNSSSDYSTCVEYEIDESNKTVKQVWSYGKERGEDLFSFIVSDVDYLHETGNRLFMPGTVRIGSTAYAKIVEISESGEVVFEATLKLKDVFGNGEFAWGQFDLVYRSERFLLYNDY